MYYFMQSGWNSTNVPKAIQISLCCEFELISDFSITDERRYRIKLGTWFNIIIVLLGKMSSSEIIFKIFEISSFVMI